MESTSYFCSCTLNIKPWMVLRSRSPALLSCKCHSYPGLQFLFEWHHWIFCTCDSKDFLMFSSNLFGCLMNSFTCSWKTPWLSGSTQPSGRAGGGGGDVGCIGCTSISTAWQMPPPPPPPPDIFLHPTQLASCFTVQAKRTADLEPTISNTWPFSSSVSPSNFCQPPCVCCWCCCTPVVQ